MTRTCTALFLSATLSLSVFAQAPQAATATDYGVFASNGTTTNYDAKATGTAIGRGLGVRAAAGGGPMTRPDAHASTFVGPAASFTGGVGLRIVEAGAAHGASPTSTSAAGTADAPSGTASPAQASHDVSITYAVTAGTAGTVSIQWQARASGGASATAAVDVDGDGVADWSGTAAASAQTTLPVTAGANGVTLAIETGGSAAVTGVGDAGYHSSLTVLFRPGGGTGGLSCTWTPSGAQCLGALAGSDSQQRGYLDLTLAVTGAARTGFGILVVGTAAAAPTPLPLGSCQLLVDPGTNGGLRAFATDGNGDATLRFRVRAVPFQFDFQALSFGLDPSGAGVLGSSNALNLVCQ